MLIPDSSWEHVDIRIRLKPHCTSVQPYRAASESVHCANKYFHMHTIDFFALVSHMLSKFNSICSFIHVHLINFQAWHVLETQCSFQFTSAVDLFSLGEIRLQEFNTGDARDSLHYLLWLRVRGLEVIFTLTSTTDSNDQSTLWPLIQL